VLWSFHLFCLLQKLFCQMRYQNDSISIERAIRGARPEKWLH
jgi:hypothetical protein